MDGNAAAEILREFVAEELLDDPLGSEDVSGDLNIDTPLLDHGIINSLSVVILSNFVEEHFGVTIPPSEMTSENLASIRQVAAMVVRLSNARDGD